MPRDGSTGQFNLPAGNPYVNGTVIDETVVNATMSDIATGLTNSIAKDGQTTVTGNIPMGGNKFTNVAAGSAANQNPIISQIQDGSLLALGSVSGTDTITAALTPAITSYATGATYQFKPAATNTGAVTIVINGLAAKSIVKGNAAALVAGDLASGVPALIVYDGTNFELLNPQHIVPNDEVTFARMQNIATDRLIGRDTASSGDPEEISVGGGLEFTGSAGIQRSALTGDVTASAGSNSTTIANDAVSFAKMQNIATDTLIGRSTASTGDPETIACTAAGRALLDDANAAAQRTTLGAASSATTISVSGTGLSGGGDLSANRTITIDQTAMATRNITGKSGIAKTLSTSDPSGGADGDIWYKY